MSTKSDKILSDYAKKYGTDYKIESNQESYSSLVTELGGDPSGMTEVEMKSFISNNIDSDFNLEVTELGGDPSGMTEAEKFNYIIANK